MNHKDELIIILSRYKRDQIIITDHARFQAMFRGIDIGEIRENIINPRRLAYALRQGKKYDCYFGYSRTQCHRYIIVVKARCIVCTVIKINRRWQHIAERKNARL